MTEARKETLAKGRAKRAENIKRLQEERQKQKDEEKQVKKQIREKVKEQFEKAIQPESVAEATPCPVGTVLGDDDFVAEATPSLNAPAPHVVRTCKK